ncbi:MAG: TIGR03619 family F420-dependent LLM class oxidoreductase [Acidimicrobiia bacterium]
MRIGICAYNLSAPRLLDIAVAADELGFDALWLGEHVVLPCGYTSAHPTRPGGEADNAPFATIVEPDTELLDPWVFLGAVAGATTRLRLATGIYIAPLRHPLATARAAVTAHDVSAGRFVLGVGSGWLREEFSALGVPFEERAARFDETVEILRRAWEGGPFAHQGTAFQFEPVQVTPRPVAIPLVLGGNSERALRRAATLGDGWFSSGLPSFDEAVRLHERLRALRERQPRADSFRCYFRADFGEAERLDRYEANGIDDVVFWAHQLCPPDADPCASLRRAADQLGVR